MAEQINKVSMGNKVTVDLPRERECKGSVRFLTKDETKPIRNIYLEREWAEIETAKTVRVTVEITS